MMDAKHNKETVDRLRRIETRLTKYMEAQGFDTEVNRCHWNSEKRVVEAPSHHVTLREVMATVPDRVFSAAVFVGDTLVGYVKRP